MRSTFKLLFYINRNKVKSDGTTAVLCRISIDGKKSAVTTGVYCKPGDWDSKKCGVVSLSERRLWYTRKQINNTPHLYSTEQSTSRTNTSDECYCYPCLLKTTTFSLKDKS